MTESKFASLELRTELLKNLESLNYTEMTPIQAQSLPHILSGKDVIAQGKTGSGKTAAFGLGLLQSTVVERFCVQSLVLCPTRELADQVATEIRRLARTTPNIKVLTLCGGTPFGPQANSLKQGAHIIVGTPGRIDDHLNRRTLDINNVNKLVLDEADRMLEMGFQTELDAIIDDLPTERQTLLFSATYSDPIRSIAQRITCDPITITVESTHDAATIEQHFYKIDNDQHMSALRSLLLHHQPESALVFCNTKRETQDAANALCDFGFSALALHGDLEQRDRDQALVQFANKSVSIIVATDVAARGLDINDLDLVINYHVAHDAETHTHRIGRTGRAGKTGVAHTLFSDKDGYKIAQLNLTKDPFNENEKLPTVCEQTQKAIVPLMKTILISGGKKQKVRPGDILGALTGQNGIPGEHVGKINIFDHWAFVAIHRSSVKKAVNKICEGKMKGRSFRAKEI